MQDMASPPVRRDILSRFTRETARAARALPRVPRASQRSSSRFENPSNPSLDPYLTEQRDILRARLKRTSDMMETETQPQCLGVSAGGVRLRRQVLVQGTGCVASW
jgi:C4-dicarboxylate-specific signal transduction histidine kinase